MPSSPLVTVGRAAEMLRMSRQAVRDYIHTGALLAERVAGAGRSVQFVLRESEVRRFLHVLADGGPRPPSNRAQLRLPLRRRARGRSHGRRSGAS
jgi:hypothetical protein